MEDRDEGHVVKDGMVQFHNITVTYVPARTSQGYRPSLTSAWCGPFRKDLDDGVFY
ncbi:hypothetical protein [Azospirillum argentinense]|uniref:Uncharacterized protein n=1 Tax=Azospirillum argentinense TaxID=2970906 RepID=A0A5B0KQ70_9PROT|nr:hypothetical protein [Azospirillum argentinense]KAA1053740.1 hypothetical protein FH063_002322 [Azospirillum argentinense]